MELEATCPYCGEVITLVIDDGGGPDQQYIEDCEVCCQPIAIRAVVEGEDEYSLELRRADE